MESLPAKREEKVEEAEKMAVEQEKTEERDKMEGRRQDGCSKRSAAAGEE